MPHLYSKNILHDIRTAKLALTRAETKFIWMSHWGHGVVVILQKTQFPSVSKKMGIELCFLITSMKNLILPVSRSKSPAILICSVGVPRWNNIVWCVNLVGIYWTRLCRLGNRSVAHNHSRQHKNSEKNSNNTFCN